MTKRRIALIGNQADTLLRFRGPLIVDMVASGFDVYALVPDIGERDAQAMRAIGAMPVEISLDRLGFNPFRDLADMARLRAHLLEIAPDIVLTYFIKPVIYGTLAAAMAGVPDRYCLVEGVGYVFGEDGSNSLRRRSLRELVSQLYGFAFKRARGVFVLNEDDRKLFVGRRLVQEERVTRLPGIGVDLDFFSYVAAPARPTTFLIAARLIAAKGVRYFCEAAQRLKGERPELRFVVLGGPDPFAKSLSIDEMNRYVEAGVIEWPGHVEDVRPWLHQASAFVLPTYYREGLPRSIMEAMSVGRPIITTDSAGCRDTVSHGSNGYLIPRHDVGALVEAMKRLADQPEQLEAMGRQSRAMAEQHFDVRKVNRLLMNAMAIDCSYAKSERISLDEVQA